MAQWLQAQLNTATQLLETVDRTISKTVVGSRSSDDFGDSDDPVGLPTSTAAPDTPNGYMNAGHAYAFQPSNHTRAAPPLPPPLSAGSSLLAQKHFTVAPTAASHSHEATPYTILKSNPFDSPARQPTVPAPVSPSAPAASKMLFAAGGSGRPFSAGSAPTPGMPSATQTFNASLPANTGHASNPGAATSLENLETPFPAAAPAPASSVNPPQAAADHHSGPTIPSSAQAAPKKAAQVQPPPAGAMAAAAAAAVTPAQNSGAIKLVEQLRKRLEASEAENEQLEEMLKREEARAGTAAAAALRLAEELSALQDSQAQAEAALSSQLAAQLVAGRDLAARLEAAQRQVFKLEATVVSLEESRRHFEESRSGMEGGMLEALKSHLEAAESRLEAERRLHSATRAGAAAREHELESRLADGGAALSDMQRALEEAGEKGRDLEDNLALLQSSYKEALAQLQEAQQGDRQGAAGARAGSASAAAAAAAAADAELVEELRSDLSQQQRACHASEVARQAAEAQAAGLAEQVAELRAEVEAQVARGDMAQLEARLREVTDMLYLKQNQLERLSADKAASQILLERELQQARDEAARLRPAASGGSGIMLGGGNHGHDVIPMDALGEPYQRLVQNSSVGKAVKAAAKFVDLTASTASFLLRQYPLARLLALAYLFLIHLYVYFLIARLQGRAVGLENVAGGATLHTGVAATQLHLPGIPSTPLS